MTVVSEQSVNARISRLLVYPVKSCAGVEVTECVLTETGFDLDRAWMVVDEQGEFISQREFPRLALVKPLLKHNELILRAPGMLALHMAIDGVEGAVKVRVWDDIVSAYDMGNVAAQWFSDFLSLSREGLPTPNSPKFRLVRFDPDCRRLSSRQWTGQHEATNQFSDGYPLLVLSQSALDDLNLKLQAAGESPVLMERFRPNIVLSDINAHDEDRVEVLTIRTPGEPVVLKLVKPCPRCPIPNIDPLTAISTPAVGDMLQTYRQDVRVNGAVTFGMNAIILSGLDGVLSVGQTVQGDYRFD
jgi:uncharacterized protein YcbX